MEVAISKQATPRRPVMAMAKSAARTRRQPSTKPAIPETQSADRPVSQCWRCAREIVGGAVISGEHAYCSIACAQSVPGRYLG